MNRYWFNTKTGEVLDAKNASLAEFMLRADNPDSDIVPISADAYYRIVVTNKVIKTLCESDEIERLCQRKINSR